MSMNINFIFDSITENELLAILIALIPVLFGIIFAKRYNIIHGLITCFVFTFLVYFAIEMIVKFGNNLPDKVTEIFTSVEDVYMYMGMKILALTAELLAKIPFLTDILGSENGIYVLLGIYLVIFIILQIIASSIARSRKDKIKALKAQLRRY